MKTNFATDKKTTKPKELPQRTSDTIVRQNHIVLDKERAQQWEAERRIRANPVQVTRDPQSTTPLSSDIIFAQVFIQSDPGTTVIQYLRKREAELISEISQIDQATSVIEKTYKLS